MHIMEDHGDSDFKMDYVLADYQFTGCMASEVVTTVLNPGSHPNHASITFGTEMAETIASRGVIEFAKVIREPSEFKVVRRFEEVIHNILGRAARWAHGHDAV